MTPQVAATLPTGIESAARRCSPASEESVTKAMHTKDNWLRGSRRESGRSNEASLEVSSEDTKVSSAPARGDTIQDTQTSGSNEASSVVPSEATKVSSAPAQCDTIQDTRDILHHGATYTYYTYILYMRIHTIRKVTRRAWPLSEPRCCRRTRTHTSR